MTPLAWVNIPVFDYKGTLRCGEHKLHMWPVTDEDILTEELLNPIGEMQLSHPVTAGLNNYTLQCVGLTAYIGPLTLAPVHSSDSPIFVFA